MSLDAAREYVLRAETDKVLKVRMRDLDSDQIVKEAQRSGYVFDASELASVMEEKRGMANEDDADYALDLADLSQAAGGYQLTCNYAY